MQSDIQSDACPENLATTSNECVCDVVIVQAGAAVASCHRQARDLASFSFPPLISLLSSFNRDIWDGSGDNNAAKGPVQRPTLKHGPFHFEKSSAHLGILELENTARINRIHGTGKSLYVILDRAVTQEMIIELRKSEDFP